MWTVIFKRKVKKEIKKLPKPIQYAVAVLVGELKTGPHINWPNFGKIKGKKETYHCHIKKGKPTYVAVWEVVDKSIKLVEVTYVGTHEKANY